MELMDTPFILLLDALAPARANSPASCLPAGRFMAENCEEALTFLHTCPVSLVLADCTRPASQGPQLLARMQLEPALSAIPVLALVSLEKRNRRGTGLFPGRVRYHRGTGAAGGTLPPGAQHFARTAAYTAPPYRGACGSPARWVPRRSFYASPIPNPAPALTVPPKAFTPVPTGHARAVPYGAPDCVRQPPGPSQSPQTAPCSRTTGPATCFGDQSRPCGHLPATRTL